MASPAALSFFQFLPGHVLVPLVHVVDRVRVGIVSNYKKADLPAVVA
jgi:uncharacterized membrane protein